MPFSRLLAIETSTDTLSVAVGSGEATGPCWQHTGPGGAQASATLLPLVQALLAQAGWPLASLDAVVFGRGPGSFTGLRTACAVAQGLAYGARSPSGLPVLPVDTLLALAEEARWTQAAQGLPAADTIVALLDARMGELYVAPYARESDGLRATAPVRLCAPADLPAYLDAHVPAAHRVLLAGNARAAYPDALGRLASDHLAVLPTATALLRLAQPLLTAGAAVAARDAWPLYVRDKVALTTAERESPRAEARP
ncbi:tRNA (adenosine(37)-N6)-threonylcarbamoyltransferase complex dimerization subunit type 1 TsaB [Hydrogenophaga sp.]|uniref:tRNA (adenosine(37)-N6)-threonylcarbamoyltransferase complex dimerization subunit type 1 TsaB n=1 Tax=Hydrogenophaga sp. TaxID=1904254 RepID=UPI00261D089B|nr:tRNA (adenosine(37)-N6)-threonylcarbamoyltransferase complex dimerization subunit type 1 TsaB [Hydrogenophaga sp.]MCW5653965.1 tRNA (adenosine(37)-N6)-threonylcarbamoyltransferase complex dimerization subunit type 1 TsaB [Hydrogenophaga sp.]